MMAKRMKEEGLGKWPNSIHLSPSLGWRGNGHGERVNAMKAPRNVEPSGKNLFGYLGGILAERLGYKSPIQLPM